MHGTTRRRFLTATACGAAFVSLPGLIGGCGREQLLGPKPPSRTAAAPPPGSASAGPPLARLGYFEAFGVNAALLARVLSRGLARGGDYCEVFLQHKLEHTVGLEDGEVNRAYSQVALGAGIRVLKGEATGYAFCEDLGEAALLAAAAMAASVADGPPGAEVRPLQAAVVPSRYAVALPWNQVGIDRKLPIVQQVEKLARGLDARIVKVRVWFDDEESHVLVADSEGRLVEDDQPMTSLSVSCVAQKGGKLEKSGHSLASRDSIDFYTAPRLHKLATSAVEYTTMLFDASQPPAGEYPVVLAPGLSGILLHEAIGHGMEADFNRKGLSIYADRVGKRIAPDDVTIVDDGTNERMRGSINVDDEGIPGQRTVLVENGILRSYMHDRISSRHYRVAPTGSGRRESFRFPPVPRMRNTYMLAGRRKPEEIIASVKKGLYAELFTNGQVHIGAGDFTFYLKHGRMIEDGKLTRVVKDANLIGNGPKVLEHVDLVGDDLAMYSGPGYCGKDGQRIPVGFGLPTARAGAISIGGKRS